MGWFSRTKAAKVPRWAFRIGWEDFVAQAHEEARAYGLRIDDAVLADGSIPLPESAHYDRWDLRELATRCRDLEPHEWRGQIRASLHRAYGREGDVEIVSGAPASARVVKQSAPKALARVTTVPPTSLRERLRVQVFGRDYIASIHLSTEHVAMRPFGDAWLVVVQDLGGGETTVQRAELAAAGLSLDEAFAIGRANGVDDTAPHATNTTFGAPGATIELAVANSFYLSAVILEIHARMDPAQPIVAVAISWHHWMMISLERGVATRATLVAAVDLLGKLREGIAVQRSEWIGTSLWWWPVGSDPIPFTLDGELPRGLAEVLAS